MHYQPCQLLASASHRRTERTRLSRFINYQLDDYSYAIKRDETIPAERSPSAQGHGLIKIAAGQRCNNEPSRISIIRSYANGTPRQARAIFAVYQEREREREEHVANSTIFHSRNLVEFAAS